MMAVKIGPSTWAKTRTWSVCCTNHPAVRLSVAPWAWFGLQNCFFLFQPIFLSAKKVSRITLCLFTPLMLLLFCFALHSCALIIYALFSHKLLILFHVSFNVTYFPLTWLTSLGSTILFFKALACLLVVFLQWKIVRETMVQQRSPTSCPKLRTWNGCCRSKTPIRFL